MDTESAPQDEEAQARPGRLGPLLVVLLIFGLGLFWWWLPDGGLEEEPAPAITTDASSLSGETYAELSGELSVRQEALTRLQQQLDHRKLQDVQSYVSPERAQELARQVVAWEDLSKAPDLTISQLRDLAGEVNIHWSQRMRSLRQFLSNSRSGLPQVPPLDHALISRMRGDAAAERYRAQHQQLVFEVERLRKAHNEGFIADLAGRAERLTRLTNLRYELFRRLVALGSWTVLEDPASWIRDVQMEIYCLPARKGGIFLLSLGKLQQRTGGGPAFYLALLTQLAQGVAALALALWGCYQVSRRCQKYPAGVTGAFLWVGVWGACLLCQQVVLFTVMDPIRAFPVLLGYYALYRAYGQLAAGPLIQAVDSSVMGRSLGVRPRAARDLARVGHFLLARGLTIGLSQAVAGAGHLLCSVELAFDLFSRLLYWWLAWSWRRELGDALVRQLPGPLGRALGRLCRSRGTGLVVAPLAVPLVALLSVFYSLVLWSLRHEWGAQVSARLIRHWEESVKSLEGPELASIPPEYAERFRSFGCDYAAGWESLDPNFKAGIEGEIAAWMEGRGVESRLAVHGWDPAALSALTADLQQRFSGNLRVVTLELEERIHTRPDLIGQLALALGLKADCGEEQLLETLNQLPRSLILINQSQRLFLACLGGFEALRTLVEIMARFRHRIFWSLALPTQTLRYLKMVTPDLALFPVVAALPRWNEKAIQQIVQASHQATGRPYRFSNVLLRAAEATPGTSAEGHYAKVLTSVCGGSPSLAKELWLDSARLDSDGTIVIGPPSKNPVKRLLEMPSAASYLLSALIRHGDLSLAEAVAATGIHQDRVFPAWERCLEIGVLHNVGPSRYQVAPRWSADVRRYLSERNLLDGE